MMAPTIDGVLLGTAPTCRRSRRVAKRSTSARHLGVRCVLYEMLTGQRAFGGETTSDTIAAILEREPDWTKLPSSTPASIATLLRRCVTKDPKRRWRDIGDAKSVLDEDSGVGPVAVPGSRPTLRRKAGWIAAAIFFVAAVAIGTLWIRSRGRSEPSVSRVMRLTTGPANDFSPAISPDGKWVAYMSDARGVVDVWVKFVTGGDPVNLTASTDLDVRAANRQWRPIPSRPMGRSLLQRGASRPARRAPSARGVLTGAASAARLEKCSTPAARRAGRRTADGLPNIVQGGSGGDAIWVADADGANPRSSPPSAAACTSTGPRGRVTADTFISITPQPGKQRAVLDLPRRRKWRSDRSRRRNGSPERCFPAFTNRWPRSHLRVESP
jgi:hypothetical protein